MNIYDFADKLSADKSLSTEVIHTYVESLVEQMSIDEIVEAYKEGTRRELHQYTRDDGFDSLVEEIVKVSPELLEKYDIDTDLATV